ncbi:efflux RND transporter periplasmic adaptor subunit [Nibricoccus sp. IMCC34717]|uniref:efflux RND transporter periplasmic adaptor subunit n=1 Tax=Nibricoccus sp. IMCC34717 TaxID=3034021 RepID=UPI00385025CD
MRALLALLLGASLLAGCAKPAASAAKPAPARLPEGTEVSVVRAVDAEVEVFGTLQAVRRAALAFRLLGTVASVDVALGEAVKEGEVLARLQSDDLLARLTQAEAGLNTARRDVERERVLAEKGASTAESVRLLEDRLAGAAATVRELQVLVSYATLRAPFAGRLSRRAVEPGDFVAPGQTVFELSGDGALEVEARVPQTTAAGLSLGSSVRVTIAAATFTAQVREIAAAADPSTRAVTVKLALPSGVAAVPGSFARVHLSIDGVSTFIIPQRATFRSGQLESVYVVDPAGEVTQRFVRLGNARDGVVEVLAGLSRGESVVTDAAAFRLRSADVGARAP